MKKNKNKIIKKDSSNRKINKEENNKILIIKLNNM